MAMDKLQPIIKHHFWIVFCVALILPPIAWWMTTGKLAADIADRTSSLDSTLNGIASGQDAPNSDWANGVNQLISIRTESNRLALDRLWNAQNDLMVWPPDVAKAMVNCPHRGEVEDVRIRQTLPDDYSFGYENEVKRVWLIAEPIDDGKTRIDPKLKQKVVFPYQSMPRTPADKWSLLPPTWQEIWNAQEDLWLLSEVLGAVREANGSTSSITDSYVKQIMQVELFGGKRADAPDSSGGSPGNSSGGPTMPGSPFRGRSGSRGGATALSKPAEFSIAEEYEVASTGPQSGYGTAGSPGSGDSASNSEASTDPNSDENRYLQSEDAYRTRGFKLRVAVDQMQVPNLIRELLNSQYPIEIIRFQQSAMNPEEPGKPTGRPSNSPGGNSFASNSPGGDSSEDYDESSEAASLEGSSDSDEFGFDDDSGAGSGGLSGKSYTVPAIANVQASLQDRDLVDLVVIGEIYIYNPPAVDEANADSAPSETGSADAATGEPGAAPATDDTNVEGPANPVSTSPQPTTPVDVTDAGADNGSEPGEAPASSAPESDAVPPPATTPPASEPTSDSPGGTEVPPSGKGTESTDTTSSNSDTPAPGDSAAPSKDDG
jgi:hypothetical protein